MTSMPFMSVAALIVGFAQLVFLFNLIWSLFKGKEAQAAIHGERRRWNGKRRRPRRGMATGARSSRSSIAGLTITAYPAPPEDFVPQNEPPAGLSAVRGCIHERHYPVHGWNSGHCGMVALAATADSQALAGGRSDRSIFAARAHSSLPAAKIGLGVFLAVVGSLFALFISAYSMRMNMVDWRTLPVPALLWFNTGVLVLSSVALQWAHMAARRDDIDGVIVGLCAGGASAVTFLIGQLLAWRQLSGARVFRGVQSSQFVLLPDHRGARAASDGRPGGPRQNDGQGVAWRRDGPGTPERGTLHYLLAFPAGGLAGLARSADGLDRRFRRHLSPVAQLGGQIPDGRNCADKHRRIACAACRLARHRRRLVLGSARLQECLLGEGHDVDLPPQRHLHLQLFPAVVHDGANVHDRAVAQSQRSLRPRRSEARISRSS